MSFKMCVIAACCEDFGIGINGKLPWHLKNEMTYFSKMTKGNPPPNKQNAVIMGRKTWESIPPKFRPLPGRINIVLSSSLSSTSGDNVHICNSFEAITDLLNTILSGLHIAWVIGGASLYKWALNHPKCERIYLTHIKKKFECDTFLPSIPQNFEEIEDSSVPQGEQEEGNIKYEYKVYENIMSRNITVQPIDENEERIV